MRRCNFSFATSHVGFLFLKFYLSFLILIFFFDDTAYYFNVLRSWKPHWKGKWKGDWGGNKVNDLPNLQKISRPEQSERT